MKEKTSVQDKANKIEVLFKTILDLGVSPYSSIMLHDVDFIYDLDDTWEKDSIYSGGKIILSAKKGNITLFGESFKVKTEKDNEKQ